MMDIINELLPSTGRPVGSVSEAYVTKFCKNAYFLRVNQYRRISLEYSAAPENEPLRMLITMMMTFGVHDDDNNDDGDDDDIFR
jgi:hypothetical protein